ncbi:MAG: hypothetical protein D6798_13650 [Deltaproteobacteria bacterium]|nr:MAG: hypothetical protein D6798_13650 [Deltaproteobacteria bacterium]
MEPTTRTRHHLVAVSLFLALALTLMAPVLGDFRHLALGHENNDVWNHVWGYWWFATELREGSLPLHTRLLGWPSGGQLWFIDAMGGLLTLPINLLWGPVAAYNADMLLQMVLCGVGAYTLALRVTGSWPGAVAAGLAFMSSPHFLGQAYNGISETLAAGWMALALAAVSWALEQPSPRRAAVAGGAIGFAALCNWYYGLFTGLTAAVLVLPTLWRQRHDRQLRWALLVGAVAMGGVVAGPLAMFRASMAGDDALVTRREQFVWMTLILHNMTDLVSLFRPGHHYSPDLKAVFDEDLIVVVYLGHALLWPALAAPLLLSRRPRRRTRPWLIAAAGFTLLTLGPYLYVAGHYVTIGDRWIPLPFLALFRWLPMGSSVSHAYRFVIGACLALSVLLAFLVRGLQARGVPALPAALTLAGLRIAESLYASPAVFPLPATRFEAHPVYAALDGGAVWDLPVGIPVLARSRYLAGQVLHGQPVPYSLNDPTPPFLYRNRLGQYIIELERSRVAFPPHEPPVLDLVLAREQLVAEGLRWIVVHKEPLPAYQLDKIAAFLDLVATPAFDDDAVRIYRLDP